MKIKRDVKKRAKTLFRACFKNGRLDEKNVRLATEAVGQKKPRHAAALLAWFKKLVAVEINRQTIRVESAAPLADEGASVFKEVEAKFGPALAKTYQNRTELLGGLRIQVGSTVWDGTILQQLNSLKTHRY